MSRVDLAEGYLRYPPCSTLYPSSPGRAAALIDRVRETGAEGVLILATKFCEPEFFDHPRLKEDLEAEGVPSVLLETELGMKAPGAVRTRVPAPMSCFDAFVHIAPIVTLRGTQECVDYYSLLKAELEERVKNGVGAVPEERHRLLWDNLPIWFNLRGLSERLAEWKACLVAATYADSWCARIFSVEASMKIEADMNDSRQWAEAPTLTRIQAYLETLS